MCSHPFFKPCNKSLYKTPLCLANIFRAIQSCDVSAKSSMILKLLRSIVTWFEMVETKTLTDLACSATLFEVFYLGMIAMKIQKARLNVRLSLFACLSRPHQSFTMKFRSYFIISMRFHRHQDCQRGWHLPCENQKPAYLKLVNENAEGVNSSRSSFHFRSWTTDMSSDGWFHCQIN